MYRHAARRALREELLTVVVLVVVAAGVLVAFLLMSERCDDRRTNAGTHVHTDVGMRPTDGTPRSSIGLREGSRPWSGDGETKDGSRCMEEVTRNLIEVSCP